MALLYAVLVALIVDTSSVPAGLASLAASLVVTPLTYLGQRLFTFRSTGRVNREFFSFLVVVLVVFLLGAGSVMALVDGLGFHPFLGALITAALMPVVSFILQEKWVFSRRGC